MKIDILMATYNGEKYVGEQIESILNQSHQNINLLICDDRSTDSTYKILEEYCKKDKRVILYKNEKNLGYIKNFEKLIGLSASKYFMLSDQDDIWLENKVEISLQTIEKEKVDMVYTDLIVVDEEKKVMYPSFNKISKIKVENPYELKDSLKKNVATGCTIICDCAIKKKLLPFIELKQPYYIHDWYILICAQLGKGAYYLNKGTILYRQHANNNVGVKKKSKGGEGIVGKIEKHRKLRNEYLLNRIEYNKKLYEVFKSEEIKEYIEYLKKIKETKYINFNIKKYNHYYSKDTLKGKVKYFVLLHMPMGLINSLN